MWEPIVSDKLKTEKVTAKIDEIYHAVKKHYVPSGDIGLIYGDVGISLFLSYYDRYKHAEEIKLNWSSKLFNNVFDCLNAGFSMPNFSNGLSGVIWGIGHLVNEKYLDLDDFDENIFTEYIGNQIIEEAKKGNFDFLHGASGMAHFLAHLSNKSKGKYLNQFVAILDKECIKENDTCRWRSSVYLGQPEETEVVNFSISHGLAAIIIVLAEVYKSNPETGMAKHLAYQTINYVLSKKNRKNGEFISVYPGYVLENGEHSRNSRLAWCNGDLGIAVSLYNAGKTFNDSYLINEAMIILNHAAGRRSLEVNSVFDAGICHGSSGIIQVFNRFYQQTGSNVFKQAALYWLDETLKFGDDEKGLAGFNKYNDKGRINQLGFLDEISGIGLVLISSISNLEPKWDRALLLS